MKVSIAMTTYNGYKYIEKQLDSLRMQSYVPEEIIILDDNSTDGTVKIIMEYIKKWKLDNWRVKKNRVNKGWINNFHEAIRETNGDIVFFCDQDDIWHKDKIKKMVAVFSENKDIEVLGCRLNLIDSEDIRLLDSPDTLPFWSNDSGRVYPVKITTKFLYMISPGCTLAVKRILIDALSDMDTSLIPHDALYWKIGILLGTTYILDEALVNYRIHNNNASKPKISVSKEIKSIEVRIKELDVSQKNLREIIRVYNELPLVSNNNNNILNNINNFCNSRKNFLYKKGGVLFYIKKNRQFYRNFRMFLGDYMCRIRS